MLAGTGPAREAALARLHEMLVRIARGEVGRRAPRLRLAGPELDDLAYQAAALTMLSTRLPCVSLSLAGARRSGSRGWSGPTATGICSTPGSADAVGVEA